MENQKNKTNQEKDKSWIFILMIFLGVVFVLVSQNSETDTARVQTSNDPTHMKRVDSYLKGTAFNVEADRRQRQIEVYQQLNKLNDHSVETPYKESSDFSLETDPYMQNLTQELDRSRQAPPDQATPEEIVQQKLYENSKFQKASEAYREEYAKQFKENARKGGWEIELGPNFEVLSVTKIKEKRYPSLFQEGISGGSR